MDSARRPFGRLQWVALPELALSSLRADADIPRDISTLAVKDLTTTMIQGKTWWRFRVYPLAGNRTTFVLAGVPRLETKAAGPRIRTSLVLGDELWCFDLSLVVQDADTPTLVVGNDILSRHFELVPKTNALSALPNPNIRHPSRRAPTRTGKLKSNHHEVWTWTKSHCVIF